MFNVHLHTYYLVHLHLCLEMFINFHLADVWQLVSKPCLMFRNVQCSSTYISLNVHLHTSHWTLICIHLCLEIFINFHLADVCLLVNSISKQCLIFRNVQCSSTYILLNAHLHTSVFGNFHQLPSCWCLTISQ